MKIIAGSATLVTPVAKLTKSGRVRLKLQGGDARQRGAGWAQIFDAIRLLALRHAEGVEKLLDGTTIRHQYRGLIGGILANDPYDRDGTDRHLRELTDLVQAMQALAAGRSSCTLSIANANAMLEEGLDLALNSEDRQHRSKAEHLLLFADLEEAFVAGKVPS